MELGEEVDTGRDNQGVNLDKVHTRTRSIRYGVARISMAKTVAEFLSWRVRTREHKPKINGRTQLQLHLQCLGKDVRELTNVSVLAEAEVLADDLLENDSAATGPG